MGILSYATSTLGVILLAVFCSIFYLGDAAATALEPKIPYGRLACEHPYIGLALGLALFIAGRLAFDTHSSILRTSPPR